MNVPPHSSWPTNTVIFNNYKFNLCFWEGKKNKKVKVNHTECYFVSIYLIKSDSIVIINFRLLIDV
jgi:hypothetical protein